eukprot:Hpha_TRINITY_DN15377_c2_g7::TRINITY_DN15377_c2_g7_i1::g.88472::m.88472/K16540/AZI1, CEP131; 5-azacytidine-induced protein 1
MNMPPKDETPLPPERARRLAERNKKKRASLLAFLEDVENVGAPGVGVRSSVSSSGDSVALTERALSMHNRQTGGGCVGLGDGDGDLDTEGFIVGVRAKMDRLRSQVEEKNALVLQLQHRLDAAVVREDQRVAQVKEAAEREVQLTKEDLGAVIERNMALINTLIADKEALSTRYEEVGKTALTVEERHKQDVERIRKQHVAEVSQLKGQWHAQEKKRREAWVSSETKQIRNEALRGLEPQIAAFYTRQRAERKRIDEEHAEEIRRKDMLIADKDRELLTARAQQSSHAEDALMREREVMHQRMRDQADRLEAQMEEQRKAHVREKELLQRAAEEERGGHLRELRAAEERAGEARNREQDALRRLRDDIDTERARLRQCKDQEIDEWRKRLADEKAREVEDIRSRLAVEMQEGLRRREEDMQQKLKQERDVQVAKVLERLEEDSLRQTMAAREGERRMMERTQALERERDKLACELAAAEDALRAARQSLALRDSDREALAAELRRRMDEHEQTVARLQEEHADKLRHADSQWQQLTRRRQEREGDELRCLQSALDEAKAELAATRAEHARRMEQMQEEQGDELEAVTGRVQQTIARKDQEIARLREDLTRAEARNFHHQSLVERHHDLVR